MKLLKWLSVCDRFAKSYLDEQLAPLCINSSQHMYILKICDHPGCLQDSLLDSFYLHPSNIVRTIAALEKKGFLTREPYDKDKRTCRLYPTPKAIGIVEEVRIACRRTETLLLQDLDEADRTAFERMLVQTGRHISAELGVERKEDEFDE